MKRLTLRRLVLTALFIALTCVATMVIKIPSPTNGYFNLGDCFVLLGAFVLGPWLGGLAGGIGSMMADLLLSYPVYAPATLVIKALMAIVAALILRACAKRGRNITGELLGSVAGEVVMMGGYFLFEAILYAPASALGSLLLTNLPQAGVGFAAAIALCILLEKAHLMQKIRGGALHA